MEMTARKSLVLRTSCGDTMMVYSWGLSYNLYADKLLGTNVFPNSVYEMRESIFHLR